MRVLLSTATWYGAQVEYTLRKAGLLVTEVADGADLLECLDFNGHAVILLDVDIPDMRWTSALRQIRTVAPTSAVLAMCSRAQLSDEVKALAEGADDVLAPRMSVDEVVARVLNVAARRAGFSSAILRLGALTFDMADQQAYWASDKLNLRLSQYQVLEHLALNCRKIVSKEDLLDLLYGIEDLPNPRVVDVFLCHLRKKLRAAGASADLIVSVRGQGLYLSDPERRHGSRPEARDWFSMLRMTA